MEQIMRQDSISTSNITNTCSLLSILNEKLIIDFGYEININSFNEFYNYCMSSSDIDIDSMRFIVKASLSWMQNLTDTIGLIDIAIDQYKNVLDIYDYLDNIAINNVDEFLIVGPKYKINTTNSVYAIKELEEKTSEIQMVIKSLKIAKSRIESYINFATSKYYKASQLVRTSQKREKNILFVF